MNFKSKTITNIAVLLTTLAVASSCTKEDIASAPTPSTQVKDVKVIVSGNDTLLSFKDKETFDLTVANLKTMSDEKKAEWSKNIGFKTSLLSTYNQALSEAEMYYDTEDGYKKFKAKYLGLYFPEQGDDYSAYLPVSDKNIAEVLNKDGNVMIANQVKNLKDVNTYDQLVSLKQADFDVIKKMGFLKTSSRDYNTPSGTNWLDTKYNSARDRKMWVWSYAGKRSYGMARDYPVIHIEVCFRKRGFLHRWYNYYSSSRVMSHVSGISAFMDWDGGFGRGGYSSHDYYLSRAFSYDYHGWRFASAAQGSVAISYQGGISASMNISYPATRL